MKYVAPGNCEKCGKKDVLFYGFEDPDDKAGIIWECSKCHNRRKGKCPK